MRAIRYLNPDVTIEVLISDLQGSVEALETVLSARPDVMNHNVKWWKNCAIRSARRPSISVPDVLRNASGLRRIAGKTGFMVGLETEEQLDRLMDIRATDCDILTISRYLQPTHEHKAMRYVTPEV